MAMIPRQRENETECVADFCGAGGRLRKEKTRFCDSSA